MNYLFEANQNRHKVFVSYHHANDQLYKNYFEGLFANHHDILISNSVQIGEINPLLNAETVRQKIRDEYLRDSTVTVVLIGSQTWQRKHVDWEIASSIRQTLHSSRSGLIGIILPTYPRTNYQSYDGYTIPPRLQKNQECGFAKIYNWSDNAQDVQSWIHEAFVRRNTVNPDNSYPNFTYNRSGERWQ
ncbi:MAG: TIR domain-containing protein [Methylotenera sp.]